MNRKPDKSNLLAVCFTAGQFQIPYPPSNLEAGSAMAHEFEVVANNLRELTTRIALRDKIHSIKVIIASLGQTQ